MKPDALGDFGWDRWAVVAKALLSMAVVFYPVWWIHLHLLAGRLPTLPLSLAVSFLGVQICIIALQLFASSVTKKLDAIERRRSTQFRSVVQRTLAAHLSGTERWLDLARLRRKRAVDFDWSLAALLSTVTGTERQILSELAVRLGVVRRWQKLARRGRQEYKHVLEWMASLAPEVAREALGPVLRKHTASAQVPAYRLLVRSANAERAARLFREVLRAGPFARVMLAAEFRVHADYLAAGAIPDVLACGAEREVLAALEMVLSWRRVLNLSGLSSGLDHKNPEVRSRAVAVAPLMASRAMMERAVIASLEDADLQVRLSGLASAAAMRLAGALPAVERAAASPDDSLARRACLTLAWLGPEGRSALSYFVVAGNRRVAPWAAEALAQVPAVRRPRELRANA